MPAKQTKPAVLFFVGLFFGLLVGVFLTIALTSTSDEEEGGDGSVASTGRAASSQPPGPGADAPQPPPGHGMGGAGGDRAEMSFAKVHFMKKFVAALTSLPQNGLPSPRYKPLLKDPSHPLSCGDCHDPSKVNMEAMKSRDPGAEAVEPYREQPRFMIPLMVKWVERLNTRHKDKLVKPVTCTSCHAMDPRDSFTAMPPLMANFVRALKQKPQNKNPAAGWKPLLKDPGTKSMLCSVCHDRIGTMMEKNFSRLATKRPAKYADDKLFMITLMEHWVEKLNRKGSSMLVKTVTCTDCHQTDPRK